MKTELDRLRALFPENDDELAKLHAAYGLKVHRTEGGWWFEYEKLMLLREALNGVRSR